jgi:putative phage-type endonuclease
MTRRQAEKLGYFTPGSEPWHAIRAGGIGGSEIAAVMGLSPWTSKFTLWHLKKGTLAAPDINDQPHIEWGHRLEDVVARKFAESHPECKLRLGGTWRNRARPWQIANPDRLLTGGSLLEVKTANANAAWEWGETGTDTIPVHYRCQVLWYMDTLGLDAAWVAVLIGGSDYREYRIAYDINEAQLMRQAADEFMVTLDLDERPDIDDSDSTYQSVRELNPNIDGLDKEIPEHLAAKYVTTCEAFEAEKRAKIAVSSELLDAMGSARYAMCNGDKIAMRAAVRGGTPFLRPLYARSVAA